MKNTEKKYYSPPIISEIEMDRVIVLQITSNGPPDQPFSTAGTTSVPKEEDATLKNTSFEENPFEK